MLTRFNPGLPAHFLAARLSQNGPRRQEFASLAPWGALLTAAARSELRTSANEEMESLDLGLYR